MPFHASTHFPSSNSYWRLGHTHSPPVGKNKQTTKWAKKSTPLHSPPGVSTQSPHTWQGSSHFFPRHPGAQVQVPSRVLQAPPLRHWHVKLQPKPQVPLGQLMEQSTPCQPAWQERQSVWGDKGGPGALLSASKPTSPFRDILEMLNSVAQPQSQQWQTVLALPQKASTRNEKEPPRKQAANCALWSVRDANTETHPWATGTGWWSEVTFNGLWWLGWNDKLCLFLWEEVEGLFLEE